MKIINFQVDRNPLATFDLQLADGSLLRNFEVCRNDAGEVYVRTPKIRIHKNDGTYRFEFVILLAEETRQRIFGEALSTWRTMTMAMNHRKTNDQG